VSSARFLHSHSGISEPPENFGAAEAQVSTDAMARQRIARTASALLGNERRLHAQERGDFFRCQDVGRLSESCGGCRQSDTPTSFCCLEYQDLRPEGR